MTVLPRVAADEPESVQTGDGELLAGIVTPRCALPQIVASVGATRALLELRHVRGPQVIVLGTTCATISIAHVRNCCDFHPCEDHVVLGVVAHCRVYADIRQIEFCPHNLLVVDLHTNPAGGRPTFATRPESEAERQQRVITAHSRKRHQMVGPIASRDSADAPRSAQSQLRDVRHLASRS
jgi:uncharacterized protein (DUF779 family)